MITEKDETNRLISLLEQQQLLIEELKQEKVTLSNQLTHNLGLFNDAQIECVDLNNKARELLQERKSLIEENEYFKRQEEWLKSENYNLSMDLNNLYRSDFWKISRKYYSFRDKTPIIKHIFKSLKIIKNNGMKSYFQLVKHKMKKQLNEQQINPDDRIRLLEVYKQLVISEEKNDIRGIAIIPSAFPFDELYNQRTINLAKYLSSNKIATLFIVWQWERDEVVDQSYDEVYPHVFTIPMYSFMDSLADLNEVKVIKEKYAFLNIPSNNYVHIIKDLRMNGFSIVYDIMDEWEQFALVGQAPWYNKIAEESMLLQADKVVAVSQPLVEKFSYLRKDIICIGNGYYENLIGKSNIVNKKKNKHSIMHVGYFGHLTESWFDWNLIFNLLEDKSVFLHLIGYGASEETILKLKTFSNVKYYGKIKPNELENYVKYWHVGIIPFINSPLSQAVDPIKIYEYLYFGLPTVVTGISHLNSIPLVKVSENDVLKFRYLINEMYELSTGEDYDYNQLSEFLIESTWDERFNELLASTKDNIYARLYK